MNLNAHMIMLYQIGTLHDQYYFEEAIHYIFDLVPTFVNDFAMDGWQLEKNGMLNISCCHMASHGGHSKQ